MKRSKKNSIIGSVNILRGAKCEQTGKVGREQFVKGFKKQREDFIFELGVYRE